MSKKTVKDPSVGAGLAKAGLAFKKRRELLRISYAKAALISGLSSSTIRRIESGDSGVSLGVLVAYLNSLGAGSLFLETLSGTLRATNTDKRKVAVAQGVLAIKKSMLSERL